MGKVNAKVKVKSTVRVNAITKEGKRILIGAQGPGTTLRERLGARWNHVKWNRERRHLLEDDGSTSN